MADSYGYRFGPRVLVSLPVDGSSAAITAGDVVASRDSGYIEQAGDADTLIKGVAVESCASPSADGGVSILVDISQESIYEYPSDTTATAAQAGKTCDLAGARQVKSAGTAVDNVYIHKVDTDSNTCFVSFKTTADFAATGS